MSIPYTTDVMGMALARAYGMDAETLMRQKLWDPLGMSSAMMGQAQEGDERLARVAELHFEGPPAIMEHAPDYSPPADNTLPADQWIWSSDVSAEAWSEAQNSSLSVRMAPDNPYATSDGKYFAVSGYGAGSMMTLDDYGKFLRMLCKRGRNTEGKRVLGPVAWKWMMSPTINKEFGIEFTHNGNWGFNALNNDEWRMGYVKGRGNRVTNPDTGGPHSPDDLRLERSQYSGRWGGYYGTVYSFDVDSGLYFVGGENTLNGVGHEMKGYALVAGRGSAWLASLTSANGVQDGKSRIGANPPDAVASAVADGGDGEVCTVGEGDCKGSQIAAGIFASLFCILLVGVLFRDGHFAKCGPVYSSCVDSCSCSNDMDPFSNVLVDDDHQSMELDGGTHSQGLSLDAPPYEGGEMETSISI